MKLKLAPLVLKLALLGLVSMPVLADEKPLTKKQQLEIAEGGSQIEGTTDLPTQGSMYIPYDLDVPGQSFVSSGPYIGVPLEFTGGHLLINTPSINEDITLLQIDQNIYKRLKSMGRPVGEFLGSHILLSGLIEAAASVKNTNSNKDNSSFFNNTVSDVNLTSVNFDVYIMGPSTWTSAFIDFAYDSNIGTQTGSFSSNNRAFNSRVYVGKAFMVIGDFDKSPFYASFGQMYVPFGVYSSTQASSPLTKILGRTLARPLVVGYKQQSENSLLATAYAFKGASHDGTTRNINNGGLNLSYSFKQEKYRAVVGAGIIANIADSQGMQITGNNTANPPLFGGFGGPVETYSPYGYEAPTWQVATGNEELKHIVPAIDVNAKLKLGPNWQMIAEYVLATRKFSYEDLTYNESGAQPQALNVELVYNIPFAKNPTSFGISYQQSSDALAIGLPAKRVSGTLNWSWWKNTLQKFEVRHDINYKKDALSTGSGIEAPTGNGECANMAVLQFDYFF